mgnify:CR=1 FL=1
MEHAALEVGQKDLHEPLAVWETGVAERAANVADKTDRDRAQLVLLVRAEGTDEERQERLQVRVELLLERGGERADAEERVLEDRRLLPRGLDQLEQERHHPVSEWLDLLAQSARDALQGDRRVSARLAGSGANFEWVAYGEHATDVDLELVVVVAVVRPDELVLDACGRVSEWRPVKSSAELTCKRNRASERSRMASTSFEMTERQSVGAWVTRLERASYADVLELDSFDPLQKQKSRGQQGVQQAVHTTCDSLLGQADERGDDAVVVRAERDRKSVV